MLDIYERGYWPAIHANGDGAVEVALNAVAYAQEHVDPELATEVRPQIIHAQVTSPEQIERMAETFDDDDRDMIHSVLHLEDPRVIIYAIASLVPSVEVMRAVKRGRPMGTAVPHLRLQQRCLSAVDADGRIALLNARAQTLIDVLGESGSFPVSSLN